MGKIYVFDLDGTICSTEKDYHTAKPFKDRIKKVNELYDQGHTVLIDTARGSKTGLNHMQMTELQLKRWGVKYHQIRTGVKFFGTHYIDDRGYNAEDFFK